VIVSLVPLVGLVFTFASSLGLLRLHARTIVNEGKTIEEDIAEPHRDA
jgi:multisubunit Na+/H+ antiporter MnhG subunit